MTQASVEESVLSFFLLLLSKSEHIDAHPLDLMSSGRRPVLRASRKAACKQVPDNEVVLEADIKSNISPLLHHGTPRQLAAFDDQPSPIQWPPGGLEELVVIGALWKTGKIFCARTPAPNPHPSSFSHSSSSSTCSARGVIFNVTAASWDYTARTSQSQSMLWSHDPAPTNESAAGRVR